MSVLTYHGSQQLFCQIPPPQQQQQLAWHPRQHQPQQQLQQQLQQQQQQQQQQSPPELAAYYPAGFCPVATQLSPPQQQHYPYAPRPQDLGYESDTKEHLLLQQYQYQHPGQPQPQPQPQHQQLQQFQQHLRPAVTVATQQATAASPGGSTCDSARAESPADAQLAEVASDLEGFSLGTRQRPVDMALSQTMEIVWHEKFNGSFSSFPDAWHLTAVFDQPDMNNTGIARSQWRYFKDQAKVRFICTRCQKAWTSMGGQVMFWINLDQARNVGNVFFKLYGQKCTDCCPDYYEHAIWYQEEVEKVLENLFHYVGQLFYGNQPQRRRVDRRAGQPRKEHSTATCQACQENVCRMGQVLRKKMRTEAV